jgi:hypothetical protein
MLQCDVQVHHNPSSCPSIVNVSAIDLRMSMMSHVQLREHQMN